MQYSDYLKSEWWNFVRTREVLAAEGRCRLCNSDGQLDVHHRTYERLGCERPNDVIALCRGCHAKFHDKDIKKKEDDFYCIQELFNRLGIEYTINGDYTSGEILINGTYGIFEFWDGECCSVGIDYHSMYLDFPACRIGDDIIACYREGGEEIDYDNFDNFIAYVISDIILATKYKKELFKKEQSNDPAAIETR